MKSLLFFFFVKCVLVLCFIGCTSPKHLSAPKDSVPKRVKLDQSTSGGYVTVFSHSDVKYEGELVGVRNDSMFILGAGIRSIALEDIKNGTLVIFKPQNYINTFLLMSLPSALLLVHVPMYGTALLWVILSFAVNYVGAVPALAIEAEIQNFVVWEEDPTQFLYFARFPGGIPPGLNLRDLEEGPHANDSLAKDL
jgi:hypothetical protein